MLGICLPLKLHSAGKSNIWEFIFKLHVMVALEKEQLGPLKNASFKHNMEQLSMDGNP